MTSPTRDPARQRGRRPVASKLACLKPRGYLRCQPEKIIHIDWSREWRHNASEGEFAASSKAARSRSNPLEGHRPRGDFESRVFVAGVRDARLYAPIAWRVTPRFMQEPDRGWWEVHVDQEFHVSGSSTSSLRHAAYVNAA